MEETDLQKKIRGLLGSALRKFVIKEYTMAIHDLKAAEVLDRENPEILFNLGINYCRLGLYKTAIQYFTQLLKSDYGFVDALEVNKLLAYSYIMMNNCRESEVCLDQVLRIAPRDIAALSMKGFCLAARGRDEKALEMYTSVVEVDPKNSNANNSIAYLLSKTGGNLKRALECAQIAFEADKENPAYIDTLGYVYLKMGFPVEAERLLCDAMKKAPLSLDVQHHIQELKSGKS